MRHLFLVALLAAVVSPARAAGPLTSPTTYTVTQYQLGAAFNIDDANCSVAVQVNTLDAGGTVVRSFTFNDSCTTVGLSAAQQTALRNAVVSYLKAKGSIN